MAALVRLKRGSVQLRHAALEVKGTYALNRLPLATGFPEFSVRYYYDLTTEMIIERFANVLRHRVKKNE